MGVKICQAFVDDFNVVLYSYLDFPWFEKIVDVIGFERFY